MCEDSHCRSQGSPCATVVVPGTVVDVGLVHRTILEVEYGSRVARDKIISLRGELVSSAVKMEYSEETVKNLAAPPMLLQSCA